MKVIYGCAFLLFCSFASAEIYQWVDENGKRHSSDRKPTKVEKIETFEQKINSHQKVSYEDYPFRPVETDASNSDVVMYSATWCGYCRKARNYFNQNNIKFVEYDVEKTEKGKSDYKKLNATGVPVILIGKKRMNGFSEERFKYLYES